MIDVNALSENEVYNTMSESIGRDKVKILNNKDFVEHLKQRLFIKFKKQDRSGVYGYTQRSMAYRTTILY